RHGEIGVEDHQDVALGGREARAHRVALALSGLLDGLDVHAWVSSDHALDLLPRAVAAAAFDEDHLDRAAEARRAQYRRLDVAALIAAGDYDRDPERLGRRLRPGPRHDVVAQAQLAQDRQRRDIAIDEPPKPQQPVGHKNAPLALDHLEIG